jgi:hypothetical protein
MPRANGPGGRLGPGPERRLRHFGDDADDERGPWRLAAKRGKDGKMPPDFERRLRVLEERL